MPEVRPPDGEDRECFRAAFKEVPALRWQGGTHDFSVSDPVQGVRLVCDGLRRQNQGKRWRQGREGCGRGEGNRGEGIGDEGIGGEGSFVKGFGGEGFWREREEGGEIGEEEVRIRSSRHRSRVA